MSRHPLRPSFFRLPRALQLFPLLYVLLLLVILLLLSGVSVSGEPRLKAEAEDPQSSSLDIREPYLRGRITGLERRSPRLKQLMRQIRDGSLRVVIGTPEQIERAFPREPMIPMVPLALGQFGILLPPAGDSVPRALFVRLDLAEIEVLSAAATRGQFPARTRRQAKMNEVVDAILIHELWGHVAPVIEANHIDADCPDPEPGEPNPLSSCSLAREAEMRLELGLAPRQGYDPMELFAMK